MKLGRERGTIGERLRAQRANFGLSQEEMARKAGVPLDSYKKYEGDRSVPGGEALAALAKAGVNLAQLLIGRSDSPSPAVHRVEEPRAGYVYVPLYDVRADAGDGRLIEDERVVDTLAFREDWIRRELRVSPSDLRLIFVEGDSMEPDLRAGDIVLVDHTDTTARREGIYVIRMDGALLVKQLQRLPGGVVKVRSSNAAYDSFTVPAASLDEHDGFAVIGRVVWACRRF